MTKKHQQSEAIARYRARPNAGPTIAVTKSFVPSTDGSTLIQVSLDLTTAPVPDRRYFAETGWAGLHGDFVRMVFGQKAFGTAQTFRSAVVVSMSTDGCRNLLKTCEKFAPSVANFLSRNQLTPAPLEPLQAEPTQTVAVASNLAAVAFSSREACLDLYHVSPWALRSVATADRLEVDPILRIDLSTMLLAAVLQALLKLDLPPEAK